jgi:hypothetical protein
MAIKVTSRLCECDKCGAVADSIPGSKHRRCPGKKGAPLREKYRSQSLRGTWR